MTLTASAILALASLCQSPVDPPLDPHILAGISHTESGNQPFAIHDNSTGRSYFPETKADAVQIARMLLAGGHLIDAGLMQISSQNWQWLGLSAETNVFDACASIRASHRVLVAFSKYNTGDGSRGIANGYAQRVTDSIRAVKADASATAVALRAPAPAALDPPGASIFGRPASARELVFATSANK